MPISFIATSTRRGEATIEVEGRHVGDRFACHVEGDVRTAFDGRRGVEAFALRDDPGVDAVGATVQEHPALLRNAPFAGLLDRRHPERPLAWSMMALAFISRG